MLVEELLRPLYGKHELTCMTDLQTTLNLLSKQSRTAKLWVECLIKPVFTILRYTRAEREGDWPLHIEAVTEMIPLFFSAGHIHYARYALFYLRSMESMPDDVRNHFMRDEHTMHHTAGIYNGIWSDMAIETTLMRHGKGRNGIIGITLKPETLNTWAYSMHTCNEILKDLDQMRAMNYPLHKPTTKRRLLLD